MFLPVLLVRDYGLWAFVVFAVPNIVGAAAMGRVLADPTSSDRIVRHHRPACLAFSTVTLAFHAFWLSWLAGSRTPNAGLAGSVLLVLLLVSLFVGGAAGVLASRRRPTLGAVGQWLLSMVAAIVYLVSITGSDSAAAAFTPPLRLVAGLPDPMAFIGLAPVCVFGFALCPYLDVTFHRARRENNAASARAAFSLGFGVLFAAMIVFTLFYTRLMRSGHAIEAVSVAAVAVLVHLGSQAGFTVAAHAREGAARAGGSRKAWLLITVVGMVGASVLGSAVASPRPGGALGPIWHYAGLTWGEVAYRCFMAFYGLVFPAYVWLCMIPLRSEFQTRAPSWRKLLVFAGVCVLAAPLFWMGFIDRLSLWLAPGVAIVLLSRLLIRSARRADASGGEESGAIAPPSPA